uniref:uncharacterized protein n=1 Tax=Myxine glutinosa TaxID=7769 RepID=UPI00358FFC09
MADVRRFAKSVNKSAVIDERKKKLQEYIARKGQVVTLPSTLPHGKLCSVVPTEVSIKSIQNSSEITANNVTSKAAENVDCLLVLGPPSTHQQHQSKENVDIVHGSVKKKPKKPGTATPLKGVQKVIHKYTGPGVLSSHRSLVSNLKNARPILATNPAMHSAATINRVPVQARGSRTLNKVYKSLDTPKCAGAVRSSAGVRRSSPSVKLQQDFVHTQKDDRPVKKQTKMTRPFQHFEDSYMRFESVQTPNIKQCFSLRKSLNHTTNIQKSHRRTWTPKDGEVRLTDAQQDRLNKLNEWKARTRRVYKRPLIEKQCHNIGSCDTQAKGRGVPVGSFPSGDEEVFCQRIDRVLARYEELIEQDEEVDLVAARRELPMLETFPRFGLLLARQAEKKSRAALTLFNEHEQARQGESQPASDLCQDHAFDLCASNVGSIDDYVSPNHGKGGLCEHMEAEATNANCQSKMYSQTQDIEGSSPKNQPQLQSAAAAANSDNQTPALGSTLKLLLSDKKPLPGYMPSHSAKHMRFLTPVRRSLRLSLHEPHRTAIYETRPCLTSLREVLLRNDEAQIVDEENAPTAFIFRANELAGSPPGLWEAVDDGLVVLRK